MVQNNQKSINGQDLLGLQEELQNRYAGFGTYLAMIIRRLRLLLSSRYYHTYHEYMVLRASRLVAMRRMGARGSYEWIRQ